MAVDLAVVGAGLKQYSVMPDHSHLALVLPVGGMTLKPTPAQPH